MQLRIAAQAIVLLPLAANAFFLAPAPTAARSSQHASIAGARPALCRRQSTALLDSKLIEIPEERLSEVFRFFDPETSTVIDCYAENFAEIDGARYVVGFPVDDAVAIAMEQDGDIMPVPVDDELMDTLFPVLQKDLEEAGAELVLKRTPVTLTLSGLEAYDDEDREDLTGDDEGGDADNEDVELISELDINGEKFLLVKFLDPVLMVAKEVKGKGEVTYELLDADEDERVTALVEEMLTEETSD
ncbi:hypothetical protein JKP88DRAFT_264501 [Tribonema minus]|uniref:Uncharacterized protein n=1 Tax=Tribonema minus TaxID=303371 RepID=A0A836CAA3_9STRA|nr:hypothetical protein JKP88DRAFT_264501 [Tribonema minus]